MKHILCAHMKNWPINRLKRRHPELRDRPLAVVETVRGKQIVRACCKHAHSLGVRRLMTLSQARAFYSELIDRPYQPDRDQRSLVALARFLNRFTPIIAIEGDDALLLDVGGCERLFGGFETLVSQVFEVLSRSKIAASLALAPTGAAAWALAVCNPIGWRIIAQDRLQETLAALPIHALRIDPLVTEKLERVGITHIGQLFDFPRDVLPSRFGPTLLQRLDQALGDAPDVLEPVTHHDMLSASIEFDDPVDSLEIVWEVLRELLDRVVDDLHRRGCGARRLLVRLHQAFDVPIEQVISLARPARQAKALFNLIHCSLESLQSRAGFQRIDLEVPIIEKITTQQITLHDQKEQDAFVEWNGLIERLQARLGSDAVLRPIWNESHLPESACRYQSATADTPAHPAQAIHEVKPLSARPLCLLRQPIEIGVIVSPSEDREGHPIAFTHRGVVHRLRFAVGPERIAGPWWEGNRRTRDYFEVEDLIGLRFWLFRVNETWKWYLHGRFE